MERVREAREGLTFVGRTTVVFLKALAHWRRLRPISIARHVYDTGITAIPIVSLIAFLISVIVAYLAASQLRNYGAGVYVVDLVTVGVLRELGVLLTAIVVAGRTGSAYAAELGSMKLNDEIDALDAIGVDEIEVLVVPRVAGPGDRAAAAHLRRRPDRPRGRRTAVPGAAGHAAAAVPGPRQ